MLRTLLDVLHKSCNGTKKPHWSEKFPKYPRPLICCLTQDLLSQSWVSIIVGLATSCCDVDHRLLCTVCYLLNGKEKCFLQVVDFQL